MMYSSFDHFFTILGNNRRVRILQLLAGDGPMSVSTISEALHTEQSAVSHGLRKLLQCHFVIVTQDKKERIYQINEETVRPLLDQIQTHVSKNCVESCKHWD